MVLSDLLCLLKRFFYTQAIRVTNRNRKWRLFRFNMHWFYQSLTAKCLFSYWEDLPEHLSKISSQECKKSTSGYRPCEGFVCVESRAQASHTRSVSSVLLSIFTLIHFKCSLQTKKAYTYNWKAQTDTMQQRAYTLLSLYTATLFNSNLLVNFSVFGDDPDNLEKVGRETWNCYIDKERYYFILTHSFRQKQ